MDGFNIIFISREKQNSEFDWANIEFNDEQVGKARCLIDGSRFIIYTIMIYPEFQGKGYGIEFVEFAKKQYTNIIADSVRYNAIGFWEKIGFIRDGETKNWLYSKQTA